mmetsp:Transcript_29230/g.68475  ORF Transcript_29230/g.68475 Transcript_29230/m.68475 type:complete len:304 (+) Transcript_29230:53-964(+)
MDGSDSPKPPPPDHGGGAFHVSWSTPARTTAEPYAPGSAASKVSESTLGAATAHSIRSLFSQQDSQDVCASIPTTIVERGEPMDEAPESPIHFSAPSPHSSPERKKAAESGSDIECDDDDDDDTFNSWERGERLFNIGDLAPLPSKPEDVDYVTDDDEDVPKLSDELRAKPCLRLVRKVLSKRCDLDFFRADAQYQANIEIIESNDENAAAVLEHFMWYTRQHGQTDSVGKGDPVTVVAANLPVGHYRRTILIALKTVGANFDIPGKDGETAVELINNKAECADIIRAAEQKNRWDAGEGEGW